LLTTAEIFFCIFTREKNGQVTHFISLFIYLLYNRKQGTTEIKKTK